MAPCKLAVALLCHLLVVQFISLSSSTMVKVKLTDHRIAKRDAAQSCQLRGCDDYQLLDPTEKNAISFPNIDANDIAKLKAMVIGKSDGVTKCITAVLDSSVAGLGSIKVKDVIAVYKDKASRTSTAGKDEPECLSFPFGGSVRDSLLGNKPNDVDIEISCDAAVIKTICDEQWGTNMCNWSKRNPAGTRYLYIGTEEDPDNVDAIGWQDKFLKGTKYLEYTANSLAYYSTSDTTGVIIDLTGQGKKDACSKTIAIPGTTEDEWNEWQNQDIYKVFRFWKLRVKRKFTADTTTQKYIVDAVDTLIGTDVGKKQFSYFHCNVAMGGNYDMLTGECTVKSCKDANDHAEPYKTAYQKDMDEIDKTVWPKVNKVITDLNVEVDTSSIGRRRRMASRILLNKCTADQLPSVQAPTSKEPSAQARTYKAPTSVVIHSLCLSAVLLSL